MTNRDYSAVIIIHMEGLNEEIFWGDIANYPNLRMLLKESVYCDRFYTTATSTIMGMTDFVYGDRTACENSADLEHFRLSSENTSLFEELAKRQYVTKVLNYPELSGTDYGNMKQIFGERTQVVQHRDYKEFLGMLSELICADEPVALYVYDWSSLLTQPQMERPDSFVQSCKNRYRRLDDTVGFVMEQLKKAGKYQEALIVLFGDHGDDLYCEEFHNGFTHAIEPYYSLIKTPLILKNFDLAQEDAHRLTALTDVRGLILSCLDGKICKEKREYVVARNLFLCQKSKMLNKSVCVTDGEYMLLASRKGMELYCTLYSNYSHFNLLHLYRLLPEGKLRYRSWMSRVETEHFMYLMDAYHKDFADVFLRLYGLLKEELFRMERAAGGKETYLHWIKKIRPDSRMHRQMRMLWLKKTCWRIKDNIFEKKQKN